MAEIFPSRYDPQQMGYDPQQMGYLNTSVDNSSPALSCRLMCVWGRVCMCVCVRERERENRALIVVVHSSLSLPLLLASGSSV